LRGKKLSGWGEPGVNLNGTERFRGLKFVRARFKIRGNKSAPNDHSISRKSIFLARMRELKKWCRGEDLNLHGSPHMNLNHACLPISPPRHEVAAHRFIILTAAALKTIFCSFDIRLSIVENLWFEDSASRPFSPQVICACRSNSKDSV
jgi:hypothetical protein